jgi:enoyl-CoA hydratase
MSDLVLTEVSGHTGIITLNRPSALNSLTLDMVRSMTSALLDWRDQSDIHCVMVRSSSEKAYCAGGDIRFFYQKGKATAIEGAALIEDFFTEEYALNHLIHCFPTPVVVLLDGIVMGGGMGLAQGASHRVVTENSRLAMPETLIGLFPDVGGGYFLSRLKGHLGEWLALTGTVVGAATAIKIDWADRYVPSHRLAELWDALALTKSAGEGELSECLAEFEEPSVPFDPALDALIDPSTGLTITALIGRCFGQSSVPEVFAALASEDHPWAKSTLEALAKRSPLMLHVAFEQIRRARGMPLADELRMERGLVRHCFHLSHLNRRGGQTETAEGIRALAVDKDHRPRWEPAALTAVTAEMVAPFFVSPWPSWAHPLREL